MAIELPLASVKLPPARFTLPVVAVKPPFDVIPSIVKLAFVSLTVILPVQLSLLLRASEPPVRLTSPVIVVLTASAIELPLASVKLPPARFTLPIVAVKPPFEVIPSIVKLAFEPSTLTSPAHLSLLLIVTVPFSPTTIVAPSLISTTTSEAIDDAFCASAPATFNVPLLIFKLPVSATSCPFEDRPS